MKFQPPAVRIAPDLSRKQFEIHFRYGPASGDAVPQEHTIRRHHFPIGHVDFLSQINSAFGGKRLFLDFAPPKRLHPT